MTRAATGRGGGRAGGMRGFFNRGERGIFDDTIFSRKVDRVNIDRIPDMKDLEGLDAVAFCRAVGTATSYGSRATGDELNRQICWIPTNWVKSCIEVYGDEHPTCDIYREWLLKCMTYKEPSSSDSSCAKKDAQ